MTNITATLGAVTGSTNLTVTAATATGYAYVANNGSDTISQYIIQADGTLTPNFPATVASGFYPFCVAIDPSHKYAYVVNQGGARGTGNTISQYVIGANGVLTPNTPATVPTGPTPVYVTADPAGKYVYVANNQDGTISQYMINNADGTLTSIGPPVSSGGRAKPESIAVDPTGKYAYAAYYSSNTVAQFTVGSGGTLTPNGTVATGSSPLAVVVEPSGKYAYVTNQGGNTISQYAIGAGGALTSIGTVATGSGPYYISVDPTGRYAYVADLDNHVSQYTISVSGTLTPNAPAEVITGGAPFSVAVDPSGKFAYVASTSGNSVSQYKINPDGTLTPMGSPVATGTSPFFIATTN